MKTQEEKDLTKITLKDFYDFYWEFGASRNIIINFNDMTAYLEPREGEITTSKIVLDLIHFIEVRNKEILKS